MKPVCASRPAQEAQRVHGWDFSASQEEAGLGFLRQALADVTILGEGDSSLATLPQPPHPQPPRSFAILSLQMVSLGHLALFLELGNVKIEINQPFEL